MNKNSDPSVVRSCQIGEEKEKLERAIDGLFTVCDEVENKIDSVIQPPSPPADMTAQSEATALVPLAEFMAGQRSRIERLTSSQRILIGRIEL